MVEIHTYSLDWKHVTVFVINIIIFSTVLNIIVMVEVTSFIGLRLLRNTHNDRLLLV
jgi:hypothetical protein